jgi:hypothetical protein
VNFPAPRPGLVIRYSYLWKREQDAGLEEGTKPRPCAVVLSMKHDGRRDRVIVLPITHSRPANPSDPIEIPSLTKARLGLDADLSWIVISEVNEFLWPGPDLRPAPGEKSHSIVYGVLPPKFYRHVRDRFTERVRQRLVTRVRRTE